MVEEFRADFNHHFTTEKYNALIALLEDTHPDDLTFRVAETPVFLPKSFKEKLIAASLDIWEILKNDYVQERIRMAIPAHFQVPERMQPCEMLSFDFSVARNKDGALVPKLIELQGFPTMFYWQLALEQAYKKIYQLPENLTNYFNGYNDESYLLLLKSIILGDSRAEEVILMEILPHEQKTRIDFRLTAQALGIQIVDIADLYEEDQNVYYIKDDRKIQVKRIYNRMIFDDFEHNKNRLPRYLDITRPLNVQWVPHPGWFFSYSKYAMPFLAGESVPTTYFLSELKKLPADLENYVLKPLYSYAGQGVIIDVTKKDIDRIKDPFNWILQEKVAYEPCIETPSGKAKCEIRVMLFQKEGMSDPIMVNNLVRISKGKMIGVRYNADKDWVGSSIAFFEKD